MQRLHTYEKNTSFDPARYETWKLSHNCNFNYTRNFNYTGSFPGFETAGTTKIFSSSKENHELYYSSFYGDGDSKAYPVKYIYGPSEPIKKFECVGHYQKRVGLGLRNLKKKKNTHTKGLRGKGKLTNTKVDTVQNYYNIALCLNVGNLAATKSACMASMYHICGYHNNCPKSSDTWCQYQKDKQDNTKYYK